MQKGEVLMIEDKKQRHDALWREYLAAKEAADKLYAEWRALGDEIATEKAKFPVGSFIVLNKEKFIGTYGWGMNAKHETKKYQEKYHIDYIGSSYVLASRIKKDGTIGAQKRLYSWDINKAELVEPPK